MRRSHAVIIIAILMILSLSTSAGAYRLRESWSRSFSVDDGAGLTLQNVNGSIFVETWKKSEIKIVAEISIKAASKDKARKMYRKIEFDVDSSDSHVYVKALLPKIIRDRMFGFIGESNTSIAITYNVYVPKHTDLDLESVNGDIRAEGVAGDFRLKGVNGRIELDSGSGEGEIGTVNGRVECNLDGFPDGGELSIKSVNGNVDVQVPGGTGSRIDLKTSNGKVSVGFDLERLTRKKRNRIEGRIGDGRGYITIRTTNGNIRLDPR